MDLDCKDLLVCHPLLVCKQRMDRQYSLVDKNSLGYDLKHRKWLELHTCLGMDQCICY